MEDELQSPYIIMGGEEQRLSLGTKLGITLFIGLIVVGLIIILSDVSWSEWVLQGPTPTCGSGVKTYKRQCTGNSLVKLFKTCVGEDSKTEEYKFDLLCPVIGRYVILERVGPSNQNQPNVINIADIYISDGKTNHTGLTATTGGDHPSHPVTNLFDDKENTIWQTAESLTELKGNWVKVDLGADKEIRSVLIINRKDCCLKRLIGTRIRIENSAGLNMFVSDPVTENNLNIDGRQLWDIHV